MKQILDEKLDRVIKERESKWNFQIEKSDPTKGANHFLAKNAHPWPSWAKQDKFT